MVGEVVADRVVTGSDLGAAGGQVVRGEAGKNGVAERAGGMTEGLGDE